MGESKIAATDGFSLAATSFESSLAEPRAAVVICPATGVKRRYYAPFARYLAKSGFDVKTFDYRGIGGSRPKSLRGFRATMTDWAVKDAEGVIQHVRAERPKLPLFLIGHSFGGQGLGLLPSAGEIRAACLVAAQSGYWRHFALGSRFKSWAFWHLLLPGLTRLWGYFPAKRIGFSEDLPAGVALEWASWGRHPDYLLRSPGRAEAYARLELPILSLSFSDDAYAPYASVTDMLDRFSGAEREHLHLEPSDVGAAEIGHFGFFRERFRETLWPLVTNWLELQI